MGHEREDAGWRRIKDVFQTALETPLERRATFVATACGLDTALRDEVDSLLASDGRTADFLECPAAAVLNSDPRTVGSRLLEPGQTLGRYEVEAFLGAGAVSEVYRARDTRLGRSVALKLLTDPSAPNAGAWLVREAQHASTLNHPHICTVYEVEDVNGLPFIVLEHVDGKTVHAIVREGALETATVLRWGIQVADALDHAHTRGIIHRDLKGSNVVVTSDGAIKVLDFGLARRMEVPAGHPSSAVAVLSDASIAGTLTHIAPEVFQGRQADARVDLWALGVMLYEMTTGRLPFTGDSPFAIANAVLTADAAPMSSAVLPALRQVIERCLAKHPAQRYQTAADVRAALKAVPLETALPPHRVGRGRRRLAAAALLAATISGGAYLLSDRTNAPSADVNARLLAVLPFATASGDETQIFLADGVTEALVAELGRIDAVRVIAASSTARFRGSATAVRDARRETGAAQVLDGSIVKTADRVEISARLLEASTGRVVWSEEYERHVGELQALYAVIAAAVADAIEIRLGDEDARRFSRVRAVDPYVYEAYLKGRYYWNQRTSESLQTAIGHYERAITLDPTYAPAYVALADCYNQMATVMVGGGAPQNWRPRAAEAAIRALQIDPDAAEAHATLGYVRHYNWEWTAAEQSLRRSIELNPSYALGHIWYANLLSSRGRHDEALHEVTLAQALDPLSPVVNTNVGWILVNARRYDEAIAQLKWTVATAPAYVQARSRLSGAYSIVNQHDEAIAESQIVVSLSNNSASSLVWLARAYALAGRRQEAETLLQQLVAGLPERYVSSGALANAYVALGRTADALSWLEQSHRERTNNMAYLAVEPAYDPIRNEPQFQALVRAVGLP